MTQPHERPSCWAPAAPRLRALVALIALTSAWGSAGPLRADDPRAAASQHFARGLEFVDRGDFAAAAVEFETAYELRPHHVVLYNLGLAYGQMGRPAEAVTALQRFLTEGGDDIGAQRRMEAERELGRQTARIARLVVTVEPEGATIQINGLAVPSESRATADLAAGLHWVVASRPGYASIQRNVTLLGGEQRSLHLVLTPLARAVVAEETRPVPCGPGMVRHGEICTPSRTNLADRRVASSRALIAAVWGAGAALGVSAVGMYAWNHGRYNQYRREADALAGTTAGNPDDFERRQTANDERWRSISTMNALNWGLVVATAALLTSAAVLAQRRASDDVRVAVAPSLAGGGGGLTALVGGRW